MTFPWNELLFVGKWIVIALVYLALFTVLVAVRREMSQYRLRYGPTSSAAPGRLKVLDPGEDFSFKRDEVLVLPNEVVLGSNRDQIGGDGILLRDRFISGRHARLRWDGAQWWVEDLGSTNGTFVNRQPIPAGQEVEVPFGANLQLGDIFFELIE